MVDEIGVLRAEVHGLSDDVAESIAATKDLSNDMIEVKSDIKTVLLGVAKLETLVSTEAVRCPYREAIARSANNRDRIEEIEKAIEKEREIRTAGDGALSEMLTGVRLKVAGIGILSGGGVSIIAAVVTKLLETVHP